MVEDTGDNVNNSALPAILDGPTLCDDVLLEVFKLLESREQIRMLQLVRIHRSFFRIVTEFLNLSVTL
jgi:hypothetical protein